jgi:ribose transport system ATP-binding protein
VTAEAPILECKNLTKRFDATVAVKDLCFSLERGGLLGIVGENGAGKSTLIKMLGGEYRPDGGSVFHLGKKAFWKNSYDALRQGIGIVHQHPLLVDSFTAEENIFLGKELVGGLGMIDDGAITKASRDLLDGYRIHETLDLKRLVGDMSAGEKQVVEILKVLSWNPSVLILDEPTASLPKEEAEQLLALVGRLNIEKNLTIIYISHKLEEVFGLCRRIMVMRNGENVGALEKEEFDRSRVIRLMMNADFGEVFPPKTGGTGQVLLQVRGLSTPKLKDIDLDLRAGEVVGLYGLMGAGMSDLAETIFGISKPQTGTISLPASGIDGSMHLDIGQMIRHGVYLVPEDRLAKALVPAFTVRENASLAHLRYNSPEPIINLGHERKLVAEALEPMHVHYADLEQGISELSGGNQQKVVVTRWLLRECVVLIVDDPTVGIDIGAKRDIYQLLRDLAGRGKGILFVSSEISEIVGMADRVYTMRNGRITAELRGEAITQCAILENIL